MGHLKMINTRPLGNINKLPELLLPVCIEAVEYQLFNCSLLYRASRVFSIQEDLLCIITTGTGLIHFSLHLHSFAQVISIANFETLPEEREITPS